MRINVHAGHNPDGKVLVNQVDLDVSIHFNSNAKDTISDGKTTGTEVYLYSKESKASKYAKNIVKEISKQGKVKENTTNVYRVQVGAYGIKSNAEAMHKKLNEAGFDSIVVRS